MRYQSRFLGKNLTDPVIRGKAGKSVHVNLHYTHFRVCFNRQRCQPLYTAVNIDGASYKPSKRKNSDKWTFEELVLPKDQLGDWFYKGAKGFFHRGHLVRRLDPCWGNKKTRTKAELDTFHFTNASPQHKRFNPGIWLELEKHVLDQSAVKGRQKMIVFAGPVLNKKDKFYMYAFDGRYVQVPSTYWKLIAWQRSDGKISAVCFLQSQFDLIKGVLRSFNKVRSRGVAAYDNYLQHITFKNGESYQVSKTTLEKATGLRFNWQNVEFPYKHSSYKQVKRVPRKRTGKRKRSGESDRTLDVVLF